MLSCARRFTRATGRGAFVVFLNFSDLCATVVLRVWVTVLNTAARLGVDGVDGVDAADAAIKVGCLTSAGRRW